MKLSVKSSKNRTLFKYSAIQYIMYWGIIFELTPHKLRMKTLYKHRSHKNPDLTFKHNNQQGIQAKDNSPILLRVQTGQRDTSMQKQTDKGLLFQLSSHDSTTLFCSKPISIGIQVQPLFTMLSTTKSFQLMDGTEQWISHTSHKGEDHNKNE